jgi:uncharacterized protein (TIGR02145 family)
MKKSVILYSLSLVILVIILHSCKKQEVPSVTTSDVTNITGMTATCGGTITDGVLVKIFERGICWSKENTFTIEDDRTIELGGSATFVSKMSNLDPATTYYVRAYATNEAGTGYGMALYFATLGEAPNASTLAAANITTASATLRGAINANYLSTTVTFEYGTTSSYGQTVTATPSPVTGNSNTDITADISALAGGTTYHYRVKTVNSLGTTNGEDMSFTTLGQAPTAETQSACCLSSTGVKLNGTVNANYLSTSVTFEYGESTAYGSSVAASPSPVIGNTNTNVSANLSVLIAGTTYHFRVKAVNSLGTAYGYDLSFTTLPLTDVDGYVYKTVKIGTQVWMAENLRTTKFNDGTEIPLVVESSLWDTLITPSYCWYENGAEPYGTTYGALYNWYSVETDKLCPTGWHVPSDAEWTTFINYLSINGYGFEGSGDDIAKSISGTNGWRSSPTPGAPGNDKLTNNSSGFNGFPAGLRGRGGFSLRGRFTCWWSSTGGTSAYAVDFNDIYLSHITPRPGQGYDLSGTGYSVRCVKE